MRSCSSASFSNIGTRVAAWLSPMNSTCGPSPFRTVHAGPSSAGHQCWPPMLSRTCCQSMSSGIGSSEPATPVVDGPVTLLEKAGLRSCSSTPGTNVTATRALRATPVRATVHVKRLSTLDLRIGISRTSYDNAARPVPRAIVKIAMIAGLVSKSVVRATITGQCHR